jgi:hypothetical protein
LDDLFLEVYKIFKPYEGRVVLDQANRLANRISELDFEASKIKEWE